MTPDLSFVSNVTGDDTMVMAHLRRSAFVTGLAADVMPERIMALTEDRKVDPNFNPYDLLTDNFANRYPFMVEHFESGMVRDLPNEDVFWRFVRRQERDFEDREMMAQYGMGTNIVASVPGLAMDAVFAGALLKAFNLQGPATQVAEWTQRGNLGSRMARKAAVFSAVNLGQEQLLRLNNPNRNVDEVEAAAMAFGMGAFFGASIPVFVSGGRGMANKLQDSGRIKKLQAATAQYFADPQATNPRDLVSMTVSDLEAKLASGEAVETITPIITPKTSKLINRLQEKNPDMRVMDHPDQDAVDDLLTLERLERDAGKAMKAKGTNAFTTRYADLLSAMSPAARARRSGSSVARRAFRAIFDDTTATIDSVNRPVTNVVNTPAEMIRQGYDAWMIEMRLKTEGRLTEALKGKGKSIDYTFADGEQVRLTRKDYRAFGRATIDYMRRAETARRLKRPAPEAHTSIKQAADDVLEYTKRIADDASVARLLKEDVANSGYYLPQRWKPWEVLRRQKEFVDRLYAQFVRNREVDFKTGRVLTAADRPVDVDNVVKFDREARDAGRGLNAAERNEILEYIDNDGVPRQDVTEQQLRDALGDKIADRYEEEVGLYLRGAAESSRDSIIGLDNSHGVTDAMGNDVFKRRLLQINQDDFSDFLVEDLEDLIGGYHQQVSGKLAIRYALSKDTDLINDLDEMGFDLRGNDFDPQVLVTAVKQDFADQIRVAERAGDDKLKNAIEKNQSSTMKVLTAKIDELQGINPMTKNPAAYAGFKLLARLSLRLPAMAFLGKVAISSMTDLAVHAFSKGLTRQHIKTTARALNLMKSVPDYGLEALYVANSDMIRSSRALGTFDLDNLGEMRQFGPGRFAQGLEAIDQTSDAATNTFFKVSGMNRWNRNQKRTMSHLVLTEFMRGAKKMAQAQRLVRNGMDEIDAVQKVGLSPEDARLLNRLGINGARSERLMKLMTLHGRALDLKDGTKKPWKSQADFERYDGYVSPEFYAWWKKDRDLFDTLTGAVNSYVQDMIVEPKLLSRPLMNNTWIGRVFNQFQAFAFAWGNQHAQLAAQRPMFEQMQGIFLSVGLAAIVDALHNQLSGQRSLGETAEQWGENPAGMLYGAFNRSSLAGWLVRPIGFADQTPIGPGRLLGNEALTGTYSRPIEPSGFLLGPFGSWADTTAKALMLSAYEGEISDSRKRQLWNGLPYHNIWFLEAGIRAAEEMGIETPSFTRPAERR